MSSIKTTAPFFLVLDINVLGDIFENEHCLFDDDLWMGQSQFPELQKKSRNAILKRADTLVPGHGAMFQVETKPKQGRGLNIVLALR